MVNPKEVEIAEIKLSIHCIPSVLRVPPAAFLPLLCTKKKRPDRSSPRKNPLNREESQSDRLVLRQVLILRRAWHSFRYISSVELAVKQMAKAGAGSTPKNVKAVVCTASALEVTGLNDC
jgi:hypothetical protein